MLAVLGLSPDPDSDRAGETPPARAGEASSARQPTGQQGKTNTTPFSLLVPRGYVARMRKGDPRDPLLRQVLPIAEESAISPGYARDPLDERHALRAPGILQKYRGRVLLMTTSACAIHCRYCFRRHFPCGGPDGGGHKNPDIPDRTHKPLDMHDVCRDFAMALAYIRKDDTIREVILSGGDPLCLPDERLSSLATRLADIPHVQRLRIHTRVPVVLPERVDNELLAWLSETDLQTVMVIHANHPNELDDKVDKALELLRATGTALLNQSVLLRGVNDREDTLAALSERLFAAGVLPYYLHMLDAVLGSAHFAVDRQRIEEIMIGLRSRLPGYLVPRPVREVAGARYKIPV
uniref:L-lysine 2,3-aminomutase n=1 Tax=Candidatus Kentrum sp. LFY TaxID=2126342 RepID=A0A450WFZ0_9GAMM|nr:MAG: L-lysine 2,3-aminomutase [Candidatus Kentron sp. LFY]